MNALLHPVGPNPPRVYWLRRFIVALLVVVALAGIGAIVWIVALRDPGTAAAADGDRDPAPTVEAETETETEAEDDGPVIPGDCVAADLDLTLVADAAQYPAGTDPVLQGFVTNTGSTPCTVDAGDAAREVVISSGSDRIWSTKDCASVDTASRQILLDAGARDPFEIAWGRVRSAEGCPLDLPAPRAGTYQVVATLRGATAEPVTFALE